MSEAWSWSLVVSPPQNKNVPGPITKVPPDLSTCPKAHDVGQVDRSIPPLNRKLQHDLGEQNFCAIDDTSRHSLMRLMVEWNERAALMTCGDLTVESAEMAAWYDLNIDEVFFGNHQLH